MRNDDRTVAPRWAFLLFAALLGALVSLATLARQAAADGESCFPVAAGECAKVTLMSGNFPPRECIVGQIFVDLNEANDTNCTTVNDNSLCICTAKNTWLAVENVPTTTTTTTSTTTTTL